MQVSVEDLGGLERRVTIQVPADQVDKEVQTRLLSLSRSVKLDGFRPGKVPLKVVKRMYGPQVRKEVLGEVLQSSFQDALAQEQLRPAGGPQIEPKHNEEGADLEYCATFEVVPEFELAGIDGIRVERPAAEVTESDIDSMIETLRKQRTEWKDVDRAACDGDRITIDFHGTCGGVEFAGNSGNDLPVVLGSGSMLGDFEKGLLGLRTNATASFDVEFPADYPSSEVAGKTVHFEVTAKGVAEPVVPEVDDEFAAGFGVEGEGVAGLRAALRENMERELGEGIRAAVKRQVLQGLREANDILLPQALVDGEIEHLAEQSKFPSGDKSNAETAQAKKAVFEQEARRRVALGLIISRLVAANNIQVDEARLRSHIESIASTYDDSDEVVRWYYQNSKLMESARAVVLEEQVVDWLLERAEVSEKPSTFDDVLKPNRAKPAPS